MVGRIACGYGIHGIVERRFAFVRGRQQPLRMLFETCIQPRVDSSRIGA